MHLFSFGKHSCDLFLLFFNCFLEIVREKGSGKGRRGEDAWSVKYESIELWCVLQLVSRQINYVVVHHPHQIQNICIKIQVK